MEWILLLAGFALILGTGFFVAVEFSLVALDQASVQRAVDDGDHAEGDRRRDAGVQRAGARTLRQRRRHDRPGQLTPRRRDGQAAREYVPRREHRARQ